MMKKVLGIFGLFSLYASSSFAVLTAEQLAVTGAIDTMITDMSTWGWTAILALATFIIGAKVFKKVLGRAT